MTWQSIPFSFASARYDSVELIFTFFQDVEMNDGSENEPYFMSDSLKKFL